MNNDDDILDSYVNDAGTARRGAVLSSEGKTRITIYLDNGVLEHFREVATGRGRGYQTEINDHLVAGIRKSGNIRSSRVVVDEFVKVESGYDSRVLARTAEVTGRYDARSQSHRRRAK